MTPSRPSLIAAAVAVALLVVAGPAAAHTVADVVAVPAGSEATVALQPGHGCDGSPTVQVSIRAPVRGVTAGEVAGWTATATEDEDGTVLDWTGGVLPADETGRFPISFTAPDAPGQLLTFPAVQVCEDGEELAWISGDPADEYPAPRLLILPADAEPAATVDEVPPDAPGREQLVEIVDVDAPGGADGASAAGGASGAGEMASTTTDPAAGEAGGTGDGAAATGGTGGSGEAAAGNGGDEAAATDAGDGGGTTAVITVAVVAALAAAAAAVVLLRRRSPSPR